MIGAHHTVAVAGIAAAIAAPTSQAARSHAFTGAYHGTGRGEVHGTTASGSASLIGRGRPIGPSTLVGSASGVFVSRTCVVFSGAATIRGGTGSIALTAHSARACAGTGAGIVSFGGSARAVGGTGTFAGARGTLSFAGTYSRSSGAVLISFRGQLAY